MQTLGLGTAQTDGGSSAGAGTFYKFTRRGLLFDLALTDASLVRNEGVCSDGVYIYVVAHPAKKLARMLIVPPYTVTVLDLGALNSAFSSPLGAFCDGRYVYVSGHVGGTLPKGNCLMARVDVQNFAAGGVTWLELAAVLPDGFNSSGVGCAFDGRYGYSLVLDNTAPHPAGLTYIVRHDTVNFTTDALQFLTFPTPVAPNRTVLAAMCTDDDYLYTLTYIWNGVVPAAPNQLTTPAADYMLSRVRLSDFSWVDHTVLGFGPLAATGMFTDGRFLWVSPSNGFTMKRIDCKGWAANAPIRFDEVDITSQDSTLGGFTNGAQPFARGRYGYFGPSVYSKVMRVHLQDFGRYDICDLADTDVDAATSSYASMCQDSTGGLWLVAGNLNKSKIIKLRMDNFL